MAGASRKLTNARLEALDINPVISATLARCKFRLADIPEKFAYKPDTEETFFNEKWLDAAEPMEIKALLVNEVHPMVLAALTRRGIDVGVQSNEPAA